MKNMRSQLALYSIPVTVIERHKLSINIGVKKEDKCELFEYGVGNAGTPK